MHISKYVNKKVEFFVAQRKGGRELKVKVWLRPKEKGNIVWYVKKLLEKGLIVKRREGNIDVYNSTEKGLLYLKHYKQIKELLSA
jgi:predicted MarR family transcription regulator